jgi:hypothetical protein
MDMPALIVGHCFWDNWMIWKAASDKVPILDGSAFMMPVHQNHGYDPKFGRKKGISTDALSLLNLSAIGDKENLRTIRAATHQVCKDGKIRRSWTSYRDALNESSWRSKRFLMYRVWLPLWHGILAITRPLRTVLGLRSRHL